MEITILESNEVIAAERGAFLEALGLPKDIPLFSALDLLFGNLLRVTPENQEKINVLLSLVMAGNPKSLLEAQLTVQLIMCHRLATKMLKKTARESFPEITEKYLNMALKLSRNFSKGLETIGKIRRGGKQHIYIEHVSVEKDAQAIIGNVNKGG